VAILFAAVQLLELDKSRLFSQADDLAEQIDQVAVLAAGGMAV